MQVTRVSDCSLKDIAATKFDLIIFASGYEQRCSTLRSAMIDLGTNEVAVLGFDTAANDPQRLSNDLFFRSHGHEITVVNKRSDREIVQLLDHMKSKLRKGSRLLIDYSSMSRFWVNTILNYFKFDNDLPEIDLYFSYTVGEHVDTSAYPDYPESDFEIRKIESLPTLEGAAVRQRQTLALMGLGFEWVSPFAACDLVEPNEVVAFCADRGAFENYGDVARKKNYEFLKEFTRGESIGIPLRSVETVYRVFSEIVAAAISNRNVILIPLGPKPHILAAILVANRFSQATCLYVQGEREKLLQVSSASFDDFVVTKVTLRGTGTTTPSW